MVNFKTILCLFLCVFATASCLDQKKSTPAAGNSENLPDATSGAPSDSLGLNTTHAQPGCEPGNTVTECREHIRLLQDSLRVLQARQAPPPPFLAIARNVDGSVKRMSQSAAAVYCASQQAHLPSVRELAQLKMSLGAVGIVDSCDTEDLECHKIEAMNADGTWVYFYFSSAGYQRPTDVSFNDWFWSSSPNSGYTYIALDLRGFDGRGGDFWLSSNEYAVQCVSSRLRQQGPGELSDSSGLNATNAQPGCDPGNTVAECRERIRLEQESLRELQARQAPPFLAIAKNGDGSVKRMSQSAAAEYCASQGARLPEVRELAQLSMSLGAMGIVDSCDKEDFECREIKAKNADGTRVEFYFSYEGYQRPADNLGSAWYYNIFWSSTFGPWHYSPIIDPGAEQPCMALDGVEGLIGVYNCEDAFAVRCVSVR